MAAGELAAGNPERAFVLAEEAVGRHPDDAAAVHLSGAIACAQGNWPLASARLTRALELDDRVAAHHANFGLAAWRMGDPAAAEAAFRRALALDDRLAAAANNLGSLLRESGRLDESADAFRHALAVDPELVEAEGNLAVTLRDSGRMAEAESVARSAVARRPADPTGRINLATILKERGDRDGAEAELVEALRLAPNDPLAVGNLALLREAAGRLYEAEAMYRHAMRDPGHRSLAAWNLALLALRRGRLRQGLALYEERFAAAPDPHLVAPELPRWNGGPLSGRTLLIWREQGLGDEVMFGGLLPDLLRRLGDDGRVVVAVEPRLAGLFARALPGVEVRPAPVGCPLPVAGAELQCPMGSLAGVTWSRPSDVAVAPWLAPTPDRLDHWRVRLAALGPGLKIGVAWRGHVASGERWRAYLRREDLSPLTAIPGVRLINLQHGATAEELAWENLHDFPELDLRRDLEGVAGLIAACDLVIAVACAVGELAAALGVPTWRIGGADWTGLGTAVRPWHPTMRPWRPRPGESLSEVVPAMARTLTSMTGSPPEVAPDPVDAMLVEALELAARGLGPEAENAFQAILARRPDHGGALAGYARLALDHGRPDLAVAVLEGRPATAEGAAVLGRASSLAGRWDEAVGALRAASRLSPWNPALLIDLARALEGAGRLDAAAWAWWGAILADPGSGEGFAGLAALRAAQDRHEAALRGWGRAVIAAPDRGEWRHRREAALRKLGRSDETEANPVVTVEVPAPSPAPPSASPPPSASVTVATPSLDEGMALHRAGDLTGAEARYRRVLEGNARNADAAHLLGMVVAACGRHGEAVVLFERAISIDRRVPDFHANLAYALFALGRLEEAITAARRALKLGPDHPQAANTLGNALSALGRWREAVGAYRVALRRAPAYAEAAANLGVALAALEEDGEALSTLRTALARLPIHGPAWGALAESLVRAGDPASAGHAYRRLLALQPGNPTAWEGLGRVLEGMGAARGVDGDGVSDWMRAVRLAPELPALWNVLGMAARFAGDARRAVRWFRHGLVLEPGAAGNLSNVALGLQDTGDVSGAERLFARAVGVDPGDGLARFNRALMDLSTGCWAEGWAAHEGRLAAPTLLRRPVWPFPPWRGEDPSGRHLLVWREQGLGDELMYSGLYPALIARAGRVTIAAERRLVPLFARSFPDARVIAFADATAGCGAGGTVMGERVDFQIAAGSLPGVLHAGLGGMRPAAGGWLVPEPDAARAWRRRVDALGDGPKIGFAWTSRKTDRGRARAYAPLSAWAPLFAVPGARWISLQYDGRGAALADIRLSDGATPVVFADADLTEDLETAAALTAACDLVVSVASSVSEMAGAVGVPVWRFGGRDWTWLGAAVRPWFPTMRVWAPRACEGSDDVFRRMAVRLGDFADREGGG